MVDQKNQFNHYKYIAGVVLGSITISFVLGLLIGRPLFNNVRQSQARLKEQKVVLSKLEKNLETLKGLESKKITLETQNEKVVAAIPKDKDVPRLFVQLEKIATKSGVYISSVSETDSLAQPDTAVDDGPIRSITYQVEGETESYAAIVRALQNIETGLRILSISKVDIQRQDSGVLNISLTVNTYSRSN